MDSENNGTCFFDMLLGKQGMFGNLNITDESDFNMTWEASLYDYNVAGWYHRVFKIPEGEEPFIITKAVFRIIDLVPDCNYTYYFDNICIKDSSGTVVKTFENADLAVEVRDVANISCNFEVVEDPRPDTPRRSVEEFAYFDEIKGALTGSDVIDMTVSFNELSSCPTIYFGKKDDSMLYGIDGYACSLTSDRLYLYRLTDKRYIYAQGPAVGIDVNEDVTVRIEYDGKYLRGYFLNDSDGYEPWPEFEIIAEGLSGLEYGVANLRGGSFTLKNLTHSDYEMKSLEKPFSNPVLNAYAADPHVIYHDGMYYLYCTDYRYSVYKSPDLVSWEYVGSCVEEHTWTDIPDDSWWAPDVMEYNGKFYMLICPDHVTGVAVSESPTGPFVMHDEYWFDGFCIDGHWFVDDDGSVYVYMVYDYVYNNAICGVKIDMETLTPDMSTLTYILHPQEVWEKRSFGDNGTTEGPYMLKHDGLYYLVYSGNGYETDKYAMGYAVSESPLGPFERYEGNPVSCVNVTIHGPGHNSFVKLENGDIYNVFHYWPEVAGVGGRIVGINKVRFSPTESGAYRLEFHAPTLSPQEYPES
ncbi:MAG: glycoside hydrolase family 43 protein [Clostridia bacterium]|nr:glycoside hydrolase family 43 protein [Clostridia bacterium]